jgi:hypothetical protein
MRDLPDKLNKLCAARRDGHKTAVNVLRGIAGTQSA